MHPHKNDLFSLPENSKKVFDGFRYKVHQWEQELFDGTKKTFETIERMDSVTILPVLSNGNVIIEEEIQPYWKSKGLNLVAGGCEEDEDIFYSARRETEEETGMIFKDYYLVSIREAMPGILWTSFAFVAKNLEKTIPQRLDGGEKITTKEVTPEELIKLTQSRSFKFSPRIVEDYIIENKIEEFYDLLKNPEKYAISKQTLN